MLLYKLIKILEYETANLDDTEANINPAAPTEPPARRIASDDTLDRKGDSSDMDTRSPTGRL